jgi:flagellar hook-length control protein FliK
MVGSAEQSATLTLNPPDLGPLQIVIHVHNNRADTTFLSDRQEVRQALADGMSNLRDMMKEAGISLGDTNINQRNHPEQGFQQAGKSQNTMNPPTNAPIPESAAWNVPLANARASKGLVDTFA